jgi:hypothetical protein
MVLLDAANYWRHLTSLLDHMCAEGFTSAKIFSGSSSRLMSRPQLQESSVFAHRAASTSFLISAARCHSSMK